MQRIKDRLTYGIAFLVILLTATASVAFVQNPSSAPSATPPPTPQRGLGIHQLGKVDPQSAADQSRGGPRRRVGRPHQGTPSAAVSVAAKLGRSIVGGKPAFERDSPGGDADRHVDLCEKRLLQ